MANCAVQVRNSGVDDHRGTGVVMADIAGAANVTSLLSLDS